MAIDEFEDKLQKARLSDKDYEMEIIEMYNPLLVRESIIEEKFDPDLYQELQKTALTSIRTFTI